jgi:hypothetical protein
VLYYKGHWLSTSIAEPLVASERRKQYDALGHRKRVPCSDEYAPKPFGVHSNELVNHKYYYNWSIAWWISRETGQPVPEAVLLEIERLLARSGDLNYEGLEDTNILFVSGRWMFIDSKGMVVRRKVTGVVGTVALSSTTLTYEGTKGCRGEVMVEKHTPQRVISETRCLRREAETMCAYNNLATEQGGDDVTGIVDRREPTGDCWWNASHIGQGTERDDRPRVEVVKKSHRTPDVVDNDGVHCHHVYPRRNAHLKDVSVESANASTQCRCKGGGDVCSHPGAGTHHLDDGGHVEVPGLNSPPAERGWREGQVVETTQRDLELVDVEGEGSVFGKPTHSEKLDGDASSRRGPDLKNNDTRCSMDKLVSKRRVTHTAPLPAISTRDSPRSPQPTRPHTRYKSSYGPQTAVPSAPTRPLDGPCSLRSERAKPCQDGTVIRERSNANVNTEPKLKTSSAILLNGSKGLDLPSPVVKEPNKHVGLDEWHQEGATNPKRSAANVDTEMKSWTSSVTLPRFQEQRGKETNVVGRSYPSRVYPTQWRRVQVHETCQTTKNVVCKIKRVSKRRAAHPTPPPGAITRDSPRSQQPTCSKTRCNPSRSLQTAAPSRSERSLEQPRSPRSRRPRLRYSSVVFPRPFTVRRTVAYRMIRTVETMPRGRSYPRTFERERSSIESVPRCNTPRARSRGGEKIPKGHSYVRDVTVARVPGTGRM